MLHEPTVFIIDDDPVFRQSVEWLLKSVGRRTEGFGSAEEFLESCDAARTGCIVVDVRMPGMSGVDLLEKLAATGITLPVIVITGHGDVTTAVRAMKSGAAEFLEKPFNDQVMLDMIQQCIERDARRRSEQALRTEAGVLLDCLTDREREVFDLSVLGKSSKQIAYELDISPKTADVHRSRVLKKVKVRSIPELIVFAQKCADPNIEGP